MTIDPDKVYESYRKIGHEWAVLDGAASLLEEQRKSFRAQIMAKKDAASINKAEMMAEADPEYETYLEKMVTARTNANKARVDYDAIKAWIELTRSMESSRRAEMMLR